MRLAQLLIATLAMLGLSTTSAQAASPTRSTRPNFVFIFGEGHGWTSTSVPMDETLPNSRGDLVSTPNLEKIAARGMRFANGYAPSPRCTPSRASLFTGKSPAQLHMTFIPEGKGDSGGGSVMKVLAPPAISELPKSEVTIGGLLKRAGYATAHFGKWHVGFASPKEHGYDETDGPNGNHGPENVEHPNPKQAFAITERGIDFMTRQVKARRPFYLQVCHYAGKAAEDTLPETYAALQRRAAGKDAKQIGDVAVIQDMDTTIGLLLAKLVQLGVADNTYVIYTADHGTPGHNPPLRDGKGTVWEGGLRVPILIAGPRITPGVCSHVRVSGLDIFPTIAELAHVTDLPRGIEGGSLLPLLTGGGKGSVQRPREEFVVHFPHYDKDEQGPASALLLGNYKLIRVYETGQLKLFDLSRDLGERNDLAQPLSSKTAELDSRLSAYLQAVGAQMPTPNPNYDPRKAPQSNKLDRHKDEGGKGGEKGGGHGGGKGGKGGGKGGKGGKRPSQQDPSLAPR